MAEPVDAETMVGLLSDGNRLKVFAAVALGATTVNSVVEASGVGDAVARRALERLVAGGLIEGRDAFRVSLDRLVATARSARPAPPPIVADGLNAAQLEVLRHFVVGGRLVSIPASQTKRLVILDWLASRFEPGKVYAEAAVNEILGDVHPDFAALRRYLVDHDFLERRDGFYWRVGGTVA